MSLNPFDWPAGPFLILYATLALLFFLPAFHLRSRIGPAKGRAEPLRNSELAYLAGGANRLGDVALLRLVSKGGATIAEKTHRITVTDQSPLGDQPAISFPPDMTRSQFQKAVQPLADRAQARLQSLGLCPTDDQVEAFRMPALLGVVVLLAFGLIKVFVGASRHHPVGILIVFLIATAIAALVLAKRPLRTRAGAAALAAHRDAHERAARAPLDGELLLAVALTGTVVLTGTAYARVHAAAQTMASDGGGGDGGGGCGGGGGGGCGGCS